MSFCPLTQCLQRPTLQLCPAAQAAQKTHKVRSWISCICSTCSVFICELSLLLLSPQVCWRRSSWRRPTPQTSSGDAADGEPSLRMRLMVSSLWVSLDWGLVSHSGVCVCACVCVCVCVCVCGNCSICVLLYRTFWQQKYKISSL